MLAGTVLLVVVILGVTAGSGEAALLWAAGPAVGVALGAVNTCDRVLLLALTYKAERGEVFGLYPLVGKVSSGLGPFLLWRRHHLAALGGDLGAERRGCQSGGDGDAGCRGSGRAIAAARRAGSARLELTCWTATRPPPAHAGHAMGDQQAPGGEDLGRSLAAKAISTTVRDNSTAFGFSITVTVSFSLVQHARGAPTPLEMLAFGLAAALAVAVVVGLVTRGFRARAGHPPAEVRMLGTSLDFISVAAATSTVYGLATLLTGFGAWPVSAFAGVLVFLTLQSLEILLAEVIQRRRGDPDA